MTTIHPENLRTETTRSWAKLGGVLRLAAGSLAVLALVALLIAEPGPAGSSKSEVSTPTPAAAYDGRGKWSGY